MVLVSIIIPSRADPNRLEYMKQQFLTKTIDNIFEQARGEIEVIAVLDGYWPDPVPADRPNLILIHRSQARGMRPAINSAVAIARGKFIMKTDDHCAFGEGFDQILQADCEENWVAVPRRYSLDPETWQPAEKPPIDYMYLSFPDNINDWGGAGLNGKVWGEKNRDASLKEVLLDDLMSAQGSCWFMRRDYFYELELMDTDSYGTFWNEFQEIGLKCWLSGGRVVRNKKTWYAHLHKGKQFGRGYFLSESSLKQGATHTRKWMMGTAWDKQTLPLSWLIEKFWPVPGWTEDGLNQLKALEK